jgi:hypothetical protein
MYRASGGGSLPSISQIPHSSQRLGCYYWWIRPTSRLCPYSTLAVSLGQSPLPRLLTLVGCAARPAHRVLCLRCLCRPVITSNSGTLCDVSSAWYATSSSFTCFPSPQKNWHRRETNPGSSPQPLPPLPSKRQGQRPGLFCLHTLRLAWLVPSLRHAQGPFS